MTQAQSPARNETVQLKCVCEQELRIEGGLLGRTFHCPQCGRYLRAALQFMLADQERAPNITVICSCGRLIVQPTEMAGKKAGCTACGRNVILPMPVKRRGAAAVVRVPREVLERQLKRTRTEGRQLGATVHGLPGQRGRMALKPGQKVCTNPECRLPLPLGANVCIHCGTNIVAREVFRGSGPEKDPRGVWKRI